MRIAIVTSGTTGDVLPYLALGRRLLAAGHEVWLCSADKYAPEAKARGGAVRVVLALERRAPT